MAPRPLHEHHPLLEDTYDDLYDGDTLPSNQIITISGKRSTGTSTHAEHLALQFGLEHVDNGSIQRDTAKENGYDDADQFRAENPDADLKMDVYKLKQFQETGGMIAEGRLDATAAIADRGDGQPIAPVRVKLTCDDFDERASRYAAREGYVDDPEDATGKLLEHAAREMVAGDEKVYSDFASVYDSIDPTDDAYYTHIVDNSGDYIKAHEQLEDILVAHGFKQTERSPDEEAQIEELLEKVGATD